MASNPAGPRFSRRRARCSDGCGRSGGVDDVDHYCDGGWKYKWPRARQRSTPPDGRQCVRVRGIHTHTHTGQSVEDCTSTYVRVLRHDDDGCPPVCCPYAYASHVCREEFASATAVSRLPSRGPCFHARAAVFLIINYRVFVVINFSHSLNPDDLITIIKSKCKIIE